MVSQLWLSVLERISVSAESKYATAVRDTLSFLSVCERPMNAEEMHEALTYDLQTSTWFNYLFSDRYRVWYHFPALLELVGQPGKDGSGRSTDNLSLVHPSLKEMLQSDSVRKGPLGHLAIDTAKSQEDIAERCVSQLLRHSTSDSYRSKYGWTAYAGRYWHVHVKKMSLNVSEGLITRSLSLLDPQTASFAHWISMTERDGEISINASEDFQIQDVYPTPLYYAALLGLHTCALKLIEDGADVNARGGQHGCPLLAAVVAGEETLVLKLLDAGAETGNAALKAAEFGRHAILGKLLEFGADVSVRDGLESNIAHWSARNNHPDYLHILADCSPGFAGFEASDVNGNTPLHLASIYGSIECMQFFLSHGANIESKDAQSRTPLILAAAKGQHGALLLLLDNGAEVDAYDSDLQTALCYAAASANPHVVASLLSYGSGPNVRVASDWSTPLHMAVTSTPLVLAEDVKKTRSMVEALLKYGADPSIKDKINRMAEDKTSDLKLKVLLRRPRSCFVPKDKLIRPGSPRLPGFYNLEAEEQVFIRSLERNHDRRGH
ncbi:MAG: hypothetical protein L6R36_003816 [Xanthoria steineri]|nr:MAG: hypothetical protein L6R36_003816 [Xanthoria steineri]